MTQVTSFVHLTLILLLHYLAKCRSRSLAVCNNKFIYYLYTSICVVLLSLCLTVRCVVNYVCVVFFLLFMCYHFIVNKVEYILYVMR